MSGPIKNISKLILLQQFSLNKIVKVIIFNIFKSYYNKDPHCIKLIDLLFPFSIKKVLKLLNKIFSLSETYNYKYSVCKLN